MLESTMDMINQWNAWGMGPRRKLFWSCLVHGILWSIWKERNLRIFEGQSKVSCEVADSYKRSGSWVSTSKEFRDISISALMRDWITLISINRPSPISILLLWIPPLGIVKMNFNGGTKGNPGLGGFGCHLRSQIILVICGPISNCDSIEVETMGLLMGLRELTKMKACGSLLAVEDSYTVFGWGKGNGGWGVGNWATL